MGFYGSGFNAWGVQTNQKYLSAMAVLAVKGQELASIDSGRALDRFLAALRYSLRTHLTGDMSGSDGSQWGRTWISALGIERMMHGVIGAMDCLDDEDRERLQRMMCDEADWNLFDHERHGRKGVRANVWGASGENNPESNLWVGCHLWRTAQMYPEHPHAGDWTEAAHDFLINSVSVQSDADNADIVAGRPVKRSGSRAPISFRTTRLTIIPTSMWGIWPSACPTRQFCTST